MKINLGSRGVFSSPLVHLDPGEQFVCEAGAMLRAWSNVEINVTTKSKGKGGLLAGVKRLLAGESFFFSTYVAGGGQAGEVGLAPTLQGEIAEIKCDGSCKWLCTGGSYLAGSTSLEINTQFQGFKGLFSGESLSFVEVSGQGSLLISAFGRITAIPVEGGLTVDTGHVVAFQDSLQYTISKAGSSFIQSFLAGEGLVMNFTGRGIIYVQSHNPREFGGMRGPPIPPA